MKNKKGFQFKLAFFAIVAVSALTIALGVWVNDWNTDYDSGLTYDLEDYDQLDNVSGEAQSQQGRINIKSTISNEDFEGTSIRGVFSVLNTMYQSLRIVFGDNGMIDSVTERVGAPDYVRQTIVTVIIIAITMSLITIFFRLPRRSA